MGAGASSAARDDQLGDLHDLKEIAPEESTPQDASTPDHDAAKRRGDAKRSNRLSEDDISAALAVAGFDLEPDVMTVTHLSLKLLESWKTVPHDVAEATRMVKQLCTHVREHQTFLQLTPHHATTIVRMLGEAMEHVQSFDIPGSCDLFTDDITTTLMQLRETLPGDVMSLAWEALSTAQQAALDALLS